MLKADLKALSTESIVFMKTHNIFDCHEATERAMLVDQCKVLNLTFSPEVYGHKS